MAKNRNLEKLKNMFLDFRNRPISTSNLRMGKRRVLYGRWKFSLSLLNTLARFPKKMGVNTMAWTSDTLNQNGNTTITWCWRYPSATTRDAVVVNRASGTVTPAQRKQCMEQLVSHALAGLSQPGSRR